MYYTLTADFVNITKGFASASLSGVLQSGIAVMVASSPMLRPVFDRTVVRWLSLSLGTGSKTAGTGAAASQGHVPRGSRSGQIGAHVRSDGFKQMSESDENLSWEMQGLGNQKRNTLPGHSSSARAETLEVSKGQAPAESAGIAVTHTVTIKR